MVCSLSLEGRIDTVGNNLSVVQEVLTTTAKGTGAVVGALLCAERAVAIIGDTDSFRAVGMVVYYARDFFFVVSETSPGDGRVKVTRVVRGVNFTAHE